MNDTNMQKAYIFVMPYGCWETKKDLYTLESIYIVMAEEPEKDVIKVLSLLIIVLGIFFYSTSVESFYHFVIAVFLLILITYLIVHFRRDIVYDRERKSNKFW